MKIIHKSEVPLIIQTILNEIKLCTAVDVVMLKDGITFLKRKVEIKLVVKTGGHNPVRMIFDFESRINTVQFTTRLIILLNRYIIEVQ